MLARRPYPKVCDLISSWAKTTSWEEIKSQ
jgi:hypothetical protein